MERPPRGYGRRDAPLAHNFDYEGSFDISTSTKTGTMLTMMRTSKASNDPQTIEVNRKNSSFAEDIGPLLCYDSLVQKMNTKTDFFMTNHCLHVDEIDAIKVFWMPIFGAFKEAWNAEDTVSTIDVAEALELIYDTTNEDVIPDFNGTDMHAALTHPLSTVTDTEVFGDYSLTADARLEHNTFQDATFFDAMQYFSNSGKIKKVIGRLQSITLTASRPHKRVNLNKFVPKSVRRANEYLYFGSLIFVPPADNKMQIVMDGEETAGAHVYFKNHTRYNEWNLDFDQARM